MRKGFRIHNSLKKYRRIAGYSQKEVAFLLGFTYTTTISKWEKGLMLPSIEHLFTLSQLYNVLPHELYPDIWGSLKREVAQKKLSVPSKKNIRGIEHFYL